jgi:hypothetical protein
LKSVMLAETFLQPTQSGGRTHPFDGRDAGALRLNREQQAAAYRLALQEHGACAAHAMLAAEMRAGQA